MNEYKWISVKDRLPQAFRPVWVCYNDETRLVSFLNGDGNWFSESGVNSNVAFWMPCELPDPPRVDNAP